MQGKTSFVFTSIKSQGNRTAFMDIKKSTGLFSVLLILLFIALSHVAHADDSDSVSETDRIRVIDIRTGEHKKFHRLVLELSAPVEYSLMRRSGSVSIRMRGVDIDIPETKRPKTSLVALKSAAVVNTKRGPAARVDITFEKGMRVEHYTDPEPFRIIIDIYKKSAGWTMPKGSDRAVKIPTPAPAALALKVPEVEVANESEVTEVTDEVTDLEAAPGADGHEDMNKGMNRDQKVESDEESRKSLESESAQLEDAAEPEPKASSGKTKTATPAMVEVTEPVSSSVPVPVKRASSQSVVRKPDTAARADESDKAVNEPEPTVIKRFERVKASNKIKHKNGVAVKKEEPKKEEHEKKAAMSHSTRTVHSAGHDNPDEAQEAEVNDEERSRAVEAKVRSRSRSTKKISIGLKGALKSDTGPTGGGNAVLNIKKRVREEALRELIVARPKSMSGTLESLVAYNEGWRFVYRQKVNKVIQAELYKSNVLEWQVFKGELGLAAFDPALMVKEARAMAARLASRGKVGKAAVIDVMAGMIETGTGGLELEGLLRVYPDTGHTHLGWLFLGGEYEKNGLYPEALAHYSRVVSEASEGEIKNSAQFAYARLLFLLGEYTKSKVAFRDLLSTGYASAGWWLANAHHMKGETDMARALYEKYVPADLDSIDPITMMGIGDLRIVYGDYIGASEIFKAIQENFSVGDLAKSFLRVREADALVVNGQPVKAQVIYTGAQKAFKREPSAVSGLALADSMAMIEQGDSLMRAESLYRELHRGQYDASRYAHLNLARVQLRLKLYRDAAIALNEFLEKYPSSEQRSEAIDIKADVMYVWINKLYEESDYFGIVDVVSRYGVEVPFGRKGSIYYRIGKSYSELSLLSDAVSALTAASEIGKDSVAERSMLELARVYLKQKDVNGVQRLVGNFNARFPKSPNRKELDSILSKAAYLTGDYKAYVAGVSLTGEPAIDFNRAAALARLNRHSEAVKLFLNVADSYKAAGDAAGQKRALLGAADSSFKLKQYSVAVGQYNSAVELMGKGKSLEKRWALYMITQSYSKLKKRNEQKEALSNVVVANGVFGDGAEAIYKDDFRK